MNLKSLLASRSRKAGLLVIIIVVVLTASVSAYFVLLPPNEGPKVSIISPPLEFSIQLQKTQFQQGEPFTVSFSLRNVGNKSIVLHWSNGRIFDFIVEDVNGSQVYRYYTDHGYTDGVEERALDPDGLFAWTEVWGFYPGDVPKDTYFVKGIVCPFTLFTGDSATRISLETPTITFTLN
jgi:hypothetical protein